MFSLQRCCVSERLVCEFVWTQKFQRCVTGCGKGAALPYCRSKTPQLHEVCWWHTDWNSLALKHDPSDSSLLNLLFACVGVRKGSGTSAFMISLRFLTDDVDKYHSTKQICLYVGFTCAQQLQGREHPWLLLTRAGLSDWQLVSWICILDNTQIRSDRKVSASQILYPAFWRLLENENNKIIRAYFFGKQMHADDL